MSLCSAANQMVFFTLLKSALPVMVMSFLLSGPVLAGENQPDMQLVYSSDFHGELKPCGCSEEGNLGGILRRATMLAKLRKSNPNTIVVSAGDLLGDQSEQERIKTRYMLEAHRYFNLDAILPGERELAYSEMELMQYSLPWVFSNKPLASSFHTFIERRLTPETRILIFGLLDPALVTNPGVKIPPAEDALTDVMNNAKANKTDIVILLLHGDNAFADRFTRHPLVDIIVRGHLDAVVDPKNTGTILSTGYRGQRLGVAGYRVKPELSLMSNKIITLPASVPDHPDLKSLYSRYNDDITKWWKKKSADLKVLKGQQNPYAVNTCKQCHQDIYRSWEKTRHARALASLLKVNKHQDPECLKCHTTGMLQKGGFISTTKTPELSNIHCEACHGPGRDHAQYPLRNPMPNALNQCKNCHTKENSPAFVLQTYLPKVLHRLTHQPAVHRQSISPIIGEYDLLHSDKEILDAKPIRLFEFFNFYCSRCYVFNTEYERSIKTIAKGLIEHKQIPIIFGEGQKPWASLAYLVAEQHAKGPQMKQALFDAYFRDRKDISDKNVILALAEQNELKDQVAAALNNPASAAMQMFKKYNELKKQFKIYSTPTLIINDNLLILPKHTADNANLMVENTIEILQDIHCRQHKLCVRE